MHADETLVSAENDHDIHGLLHVSWNRFICNL